MVIKGFYLREQPHAISLSEKALYFKLYLQAFCQTVLFVIFLKVEFFLEYYCNFETLRPPRTCLIVF